MLLKVVLALHMACGPTKLINKSGEPWDRRDRINIARAEYVCKYRYAGTCLVSFTKFKKRNYHAICGGDALKEKGIRL